MCCSISGCLLSTHPSLFLTLLGKIHTVCLQYQSEAWHLSSQRVSSHCFFGLFSLSALKLASKSLLRRSWSLKGNLANNT